MKELVVQMEELRTDILPRLVTFSDNPVLLVEESHRIGEMGYLFRKEGNMLVETKMHSTAYYGFLESVRMMGINVVTVSATPDLSHTIWYMVAMDGYLSREHYPKPLKSFKPHQQSIGMLCCVPGIGFKRAEKILSHHCLADLYRLKEAEGMTPTQLKKIQKVLGARL